VRTAPADGASSFLERERAALGDDADFFVSEGDNLASVEDAGDDDLLGGGGSSFPAIGEKDDLSGFESSFPAIDTTNEVGEAEPHTSANSQHNTSCVIE
jgi:hypothetical protein